MKLLVSLFLVMSIASLAQAAPTPAEIDQANREAIRLQQLQEQQLNRERQEEILKRPKTTIEYEAPEVKQLDDAGICRDIKEVVFEGASLLSSYKQKALTKPYIGTCMSVNDIEKLLGAVTNYYIEKGYISARVYVQPQDLATGTLRLLVLEGKVEKLMLEDGAKNNSVNLSTAFPFMVGSLLNLRDIEQGLDQINRLQSNAAIMKIEPGSEAGQSVVVIQNQPSRRLRANLTYDTFGPTSTGEDQAGLSVSLDNLLGLNDSLNVTHRRSVDGAFDARHSRSNSFLYSVPLGRLTLNASHSWSDYLTTLELLGGPLISRGYSFNSGLGAEYVVYRDTTNRVTLTGNLSRKESENYLADQFLAVSSRVLSAFDMGVGWATQMLGGPLSLNLSHSQGLTAFGALRDASNLPDIAPRAQFDKWMAGANWNRGFQIGKQDFVYSTMLNGQVGVDVLYGQEQFAIGSIYSVRGYRNTSIIGDTGYFWRNDLAMPMRFEVKGVPVSFRPYIGYDMGAIRDRNAVVGGRLTGMAVGFSAAVNRFSLDVSGVKPLEMPANLKDEGFQLFTKVNVSF